MTRKLVGISAVVMAALILAALTSCGGSGGAIAKMQRDRIAYVGTVPFEPPLLYQKEGEMVGPDAVLAQRIVQKVNETRETAGGNDVKLMWINRTYPTLVSAVRDGSVDFVVASFAITDARKKEVEFSTPYYTSKIVLVINPANQDLRPDNLTGVSIGVREGTGVADFARTTYPKAKVQTYKTLDDAVLALRHAEVDCVIDDQLMAAYSLATTPGATYMEIVPDVLGELQCGVAMKQGDKKLLALVNGIIEEMKKDDVYQQQIAANQGQEYLQQVSARFTNRMQEEEKRRRPRAVSISVSRDSNVNIDIYKMANLSFRFVPQGGGSSISTSPITFKGRTGQCSATVPPGNYTLSLPQFNFTTPVEISPEDKDHVSIQIRLTAGGPVLRKN
ncbi:MAG: ABC transporter substrate-binding protein [Acidobacteriota bacterium]